ncbi:glycoside hydrolase family 2 protein [Microterricola pindariensis]|uniref:Glycosyl hydrolase family 2 n=1 Tax=Microterricola pindariensis TaxID=478010 RepID=A0ABX5ATW6_9MICO|nr:sugar-binding domain-containing protein [Microterricola pindariensis]PPL17485.1 glycosyl hydrolase family 2 [Microterricola pindariensis]
MSRKRALGRLLTPWGEALDPDNPLPEYPRPQLVRDSFHSLNGRWGYAITATDGVPARLDGEIIVPFSPESALSGVERQLQPGQWLHYRRDFELPDELGPHGGARLLLHFGAVDQDCTVWLNGIEVGTHSGGYLPFQLDVTDVVRPGPNVLRVRVSDPSDTGAFSRGKQKLRRGGIWYTAQSGIWQTVWLELVPAVAVAAVEILPLPSLDAVEITVRAMMAPDAAGSPPAAFITVRDGDAILAIARTAPGTPACIELAGARLWSPEDPFLYDVEVILGSDTVLSYFGMRSFGVGPDAAGQPRLLLNGQPYFQAGLLDQGYWPDGLYTPPDDTAMVHDIRTAKRLGFTMLRKHIKIEPLRWYYHCDRLGMLVWQDMVNGGGRYKPWVITAPVLTPLRLRDNRYAAFARTDAPGRAHWQEEMRGTVELLRSVTSIAVWVPFNEGWGQFDALAATAELRALDPSRSIDHASGWHDQGGGDLTSLHVYFRRFRMPRRQPETAARAVVVSEYGGYSHRLPGHSVSAREFGYKRFKDATSLTAAFVRLHERELIPALEEGLAATVYTQLSDVEDETNGVLSYDRRVVKLDEAAVQAVNARLRLAAPQAGTVLASVAGAPSSQRDDAPPASPHVE